MADAPTLAFEGVRFRYGRATPVLYDVDLQVATGLTLVLGPNRCGKSTLLRLAAGVEQPERGRILVSGADLWREEIEARRQLAYVPEYPDLTPYASVVEVLRLVCTLRHEPPGRVDEVKERAGLDGLETRSVRQLSLGQRRRILMAAAWIGAPQLLVLDEPFEAMDRTMRAGIKSWLSSRLEQGTTALVATHQLEPLVDLADRAMLIKDGEVSLHDGLPADERARLEVLDRLARGEH